MSNYFEELYEMPNDPFCQTPMEWIHAKLDLLELQEGEVLVDLGCGDAIQLIEGCKRTNVKGIGYELYPNLAQLARDKVKEASLSNQIEIREQDIRKADISDADAIILYLSRSMLTALSFKFEKELKKGARVVTHQFDIPNWKEERKVTFFDSTGGMVDLYLYRK